MKTNSEHVKILSLKVIDLLNNNGINCYLWHTSSYGSCYIRFQDNRFGSIRIANHEGRSKLKYKYNIRFDKVKEGWKKDQTWRYYLRHNNWKKILQLIKDRKEFIEANNIENKYQYFIPKYKLKEQPVEI